MSTIPEGQNPHQPFFDQNNIQETSNDLQAPNSVPKQFFCTFCSELGIQKAFGKKQDWKRHEEDYHDGIGLQWLCQVTGCSEVFHRGVEFRTHLKRDHEGKKYPRDSQEKIQTPRIYACGFDTCRGGFYTTWKHHCDHVAIHMVEGDTNWRYDKTIRNLLKHPAFWVHWKQIYTTLCPQLELFHHNLSWDAQATRSMREQLAAQTFEGRLEDFLLKLFHSGLPPEKASALQNRILPSGMPFPSQYALLPVIPPILPSRMDFSLDPSFTGHSALQTDIGPANNDLTTSAFGHRNSIIMLDAPPLNEPSTFGATIDDPFSEVPLMATEEISLDKFIAETTTINEVCSPGREDHADATDNTKSHSPRTLVAKSKVWLASKKSQHFQPTTIDHPDVPTNTRIPGGSSRKRSTTAAHRSRDEQS